MDPEMRPPGAALTILVVDDAPDMRFLARAVLESSGIVVVGEAADGHEAVAAFRELAAPTVVLLDNQMPRMGGLEAARQILAEAPDQLVVLFSAYLSEAVQTEADQLGVAACVSKTDVADLPDVIEALAARRT